MTRPTDPTTDHRPPGTRNRSKRLLLALACSLGLVPIVPRLVVAASGDGPGAVVSLAAHSAYAAGPSDARPMPHGPLAEGPVLGRIWGDDSLSLLTREVEFVPPPKGISAGQALTVDVRAEDGSGIPLSGALVEATWAQPTGMVRDSGYTDMWGGIKFKRTLDSHSKGKLCVVAVHVIDNAGQGFAYTAFTPK